MFDFMWHLRGSVALDGVHSNEAALDRVERLLEKQRKGVSDRGPGFLEFNDPLWSDPFGPNGLAMVIYDHGHFWIDQGLRARASCSLNTGFMSGVSFLPPTVASHCRFCNAVRVEVSDPSASHKRKEERGSVQREGWHRDVSLMRLA